MVFTDEVDRGIDVIIWKVIIIPEKVEKMVKKLEPHEDDIESPWGLSTWLQHRPQKAEEDMGVIDMKRMERKDRPLTKSSPEVVMREHQTKLPPLKAEEEAKAPLAYFTKGQRPDKTKGVKKPPGYKSPRSPILEYGPHGIKPMEAEEGKKEKNIPRTPEGKMSTYQPSWDKPVHSYIDTVPSGKGKSLKEWALEKAEEDRHGPLAPPREEVRLPTLREEHDLKHFRKQLTGKMKGHGVPKKAEESTLTPHYKPPKPKEPEHKLSPRDEIESFLHLHRKASEEDDPLVFPDEYKMGMKEEQEHADVTGNDKEATKKIVLAHLAEDPHYYTKLGTVMKAEEEVQKDTRLPKKLTKGLSLGDKGIMRQSRKFEDKIGMTSPEKTMVRQKKNLPPMKRQKKNLPPMKAEEGERPAGPIDVSKGAPPGFEKKKDWGIPKKAEEERRQSPLRRSMKGVPHEKDVIRHLQVIDPVKKAEEASPKEQMKSTPGYIKQQQKEIERVRSTKKAEEVDNDSLNELYMFMKWLIDNGHTPDKDKNFAKLMNQYEVEKFSSEQEKQSDSDKLGEMEKPARFKAEPNDGV